MIHSFSSVPFFIVCHQSRMHLCEASGKTVINAEDLYADLVSASRAYFAALYADPLLQKNFARRISMDDGGRPQISQIYRVCEQPYQIGMTTIWIPTP
jgi:hypothetical protein